MKTTKLSSYSKLIAFFLFAIILLSTFALAANGWHMGESPNNKDDPPQNNNNNNNATTDIPTDGSNDDIPVTAPPETQKYFDYLTGLEINEIDSNKAQTAYVIDSGSPLCGIAGASLLIEIPTENNTRFIMFPNRLEFSKKIGSITHTRNYISNLAAAFGGTIISLGNDDEIEYPYFDYTNNSIHLIKNPGSYYTEYTYFSYTNLDLVTPLISDYSQRSVILPYQFYKNDLSNLSSNISAANIHIPYISETVLTYSVEDSKYTLNKRNSDKIDVSTSNSVKFDNVIILFSDSMTYETSTSTQLIMQTIGSGEGYSAHEGYAEKITWKMDENAQMTMFSSSGEKLMLNSGTTYIAFVKSSQICDLVIS